MKEFLIDVIDTGGIAEWKHLPGHRNVEGVYVIAECGIDEGKARHFARQHGIKHVFTDKHHSISMLEIDVSSVCTRSNLGAGPTSAALKPAILK